MGNKAPTSIVKQRQDPLREHYRSAAADACITDCARTDSDSVPDALHGAVMPGQAHGTTWRFGIHRAIGGYHDLPNPGDMLCAALASCFDASLRMIADRLGVQIQSLKVAVEADVDVRGTLLVDPSVPVGFQKMRCRVDLQPGAEADTAKVQMLLAAAEHSCVVLQTLRKGVPVDARMAEPLSQAAE
jgi:uncharacterized OsmC-like protein